MDQLIVTGGNRGYFEYLTTLVQSLREEGEYGGHIVICDNTITKSLLTKRAYLSESSFTEDQIALFRNWNVRVVPFHELVERHNVPRQVIDYKTGGSTKLPYKYLYNTLISKEYLEDIEKAIYVDADVYIQKPIERIFDQIEETGVYVSKEPGCTIGDTLVHDWISKSDFSIGCEQDTFLADIASRPNYCTGFIGGRAQSFNALSLLCWTLATNRLIHFHSDQPLFNILHHHFNYSINELSPSDVLHLSRVSRDDIEMEDETLTYQGEAPAVVHFNGLGRSLFHQLTGSDTPVKVKSPETKPFNLYRRITNKISTVLPFG